MSSNELALPAAFKAMQTDIQVSMDDVVSAFVSQYEDNLYTRKKELTAAIKKLEQEDKDLQDGLLKTLNGESFIKESLPYGLVAQVSDGTIAWENKEVYFKVTITHPDASGSYYRSAIEFSKNKSIPAAAVKTHTRIAKEIDALRNDLTETLVSLKTIARKERQVRGRIAVRKLEDSGYANLMQDSELVKLVQLDG